MKKRLSLLVAVLMMLTLVPASAFAVEAKYSSVVSVDDSEGTATFSATFKIEENDIIGLKDGSVAVQLVGDDVVFETLNIGVTSATAITPATNSIYEVANLTKAELAPGNAAGQVLKINGTVRFKNAVDGEYKIIYDLSGVGLPTYPERVFAKLNDKDGGFTKVTGTVKKIARGKGQDVAPFEVTGKVGEEVIVKLPSTDFKFEAGTRVTNGTTPVFDHDKGTMKFNLTSTKAVVQAVLTVTRDAGKGDVEFDVKKGSATDTIKVAEYVDYGVTMELVKALQEKLANGDTYKVDVKVKTSDRDYLPKVMDFEVEGADVKVLSATNFEGDAVGDFGDNFTWNSPQGGANNFTVKLEVAPDWDASGDVVLKAKGRGMDDLSLVILKVKPVAEMKVETKEVLGGDSKVAVADIVITETQGGAMKNGTVFGVTLTGLKFADEVKFDVKGKIEAEGLTVKSYTLDKADQTLYFTVATRSKTDAPGKITLKDVEVVSTRAFPFGTHKLTFVHVGEFVSDPAMKRGSKYALTSNKHALLDTINSDEFIKVVDKMSKVKKTTIFTLGSADYTVDGQAMKLDTPVFTQDNYTMLPVRAIADALGVDVVWNQENLTATFIDGDIVVSVTQDAKMLYKNGNSYPMVTKATVKADRMFIPVSSVGDAFGLTRDYDYLYNKTSKEVTIYPKAMPAAAEEVKAEEVKAEEVK
ncbi:copper amine oxidase N-terminal domain-containing protein [Filifactor villosus]|uniref:Copper amine oxidase N-terminal domain-containing protein n=1 Tax=Filifactor villosus TaxID=29374 RepID=A0ABV9QIK0_9FIRM